MNTKHRIKHKTRPTKYPLKYKKKRSMTHKTLKHRTHKTIKSSKHLKHNTSRQAHDATTEHRTPKYILGITSHLAIPDSLYITRPQHILS